MRLYVALAVVVLLAGCSGLVGTDGDRAVADDEIGVVDGVTPDDEVSVDDGLDEDELDAVVTRMMARVETIRRLDFQRRVPVEVISRDTYRTRRGSGNGEPDAVEEQLYEATFLVGENQTVGEARSTVYGENVLGYYNGSHIVIVTDQTDGIQISRATLVHELTHALQDQHFSLGPRWNTHDGRLAGRGIVEGDANYVEYEYERRCETEWNCIPPVESSGGGGSPSNVGLYLTVFTPYSEGPELIATLRDRDDWAAVDDAFRSKPTSTEQVIHPETYPDEEPVEVSVTDRSSDDWNRAGDDGNTVGEATLYVGLWVNGVIPESNLRNGGNDLSPYNYDHQSTAGWGGDRIVPYTNGTDSGYVFRSVWDSEQDAREFRDAYVDLLEARGAREVDDGVYRIPDNSSYGDAFRVVRDGDAVVIVNAPTVETLDEVHDGEVEPDPDEGDDAPVGPAGAGGTATLIAIAVALVFRRRLGGQR